MRQLEAFEWPSSFMDLVLVESFLIFFLTCVNMHDAQEESRGSRDGYTGFYKPLRIVARFGPCYFDYLCIGERRYMSFQVPNKA